MPVTLIAPPVSIKTGIILRPMVANGDRVAVNCLQDWSQRFAALPQLAAGSRGVALRARVTALPTEDTERQRLFALDRQD